MRAAVFDQFGPPEVLHVVHVPDPQPGPGEMRVRVLAAGVQPFDVAVRQGQMQEPAYAPAMPSSVRSNE